jgi:hypothetical protein
MVVQVHLIHLVPLAALVVANMVALVALVEVAAEDRTPAIVTTAVALVELMALTGLREETKQTGSLVVSALA